jgi:hypothetical protein
MRPTVPAMAKWLLDRFGIPQQNEPLMGDLAEERSSGRSALWFWWQTTVAIAQTVARDLRNHKVLAARAIATGWLLDLAWGQVMNLADNRYELWRSHFVLYAILLFFTLLVWPAIIGFVVARMHRAQQAAMVLAYAGSAAIGKMWYLAAHYHEMKGVLNATPDVWDTNVALAGITLLLTLLGGFLPNPRRHLPRLGPPNMQFDRR